MPRPPLAVGSWGKISRTEVTAKKWRARARFRDFSGITRTVEAWGKSGAEAQRRLETELRDRVDAAGAGITGDTRLSSLGELWLEEIAQAGLTPQTVDRYRDAFEKIVVPGLGGLRVREATVSAVDRFLKAVASKTPAQAKQARVVLNGMLGMATRHDAIRSNPVRETRLPRGTRKPVQALSVDEVAALRRGVQLWQDDPHQMGPKRAPDLLDVVDLLLATGCRIGEVCALRWDDVDLAANPATATIRGTVVRIAGRGLVRQATPKTASGHRTVTLPRFAVDTLLRRQVQAWPNPHNVIFPSSSGTLRDPHNLRRQWRDARHAAGFDWVVPHSFRKTVATIIDRESGTKDAAAVLGHSGVAVTEAHYVQRASIAPDVSALLEALGSRGSELLEEKSE